MEKKWEPILEFNGLYEVSNMGEIRNANTLKILKAGKTASLRFNKKYYSRSIAKLVMTHFAAESNKHISHKNGNKLDNRLDNLEYTKEREKVFLIMKHENGEIKKFRLKRDFVYWYKLNRKTMSEWKTI